MTSNKSLTDVILESIYSHSLKRVDSKIPDSKTVNAGKTEAAYICFSGRVVLPKRVFRAGVLA
jgi:hypothetical protein